MSEPSKSLVEQMRIFTGVPQYDNFARMQQLCPTSALEPSQDPFEFSHGTHIELPTTYEFEGNTRNLHMLLGATHTAALLVLKRGEVRFEQYWLSGGPEVQWLSMSVAKSFISALVGIALAEGLIDNIEDPIDKYAAGLAGSAYEGVRIKDVLQMSSGARWNEDYSDPKSEIFRLSVALGGGGTFDEFMAGMPRETEPGTRCMYNSADTQALGMLVAAASGRSITQYMQEKLYAPLGMASRGFWITDRLGREMAYGGLLLTARDFVKIGELYRNGGKWRDRQLIPSDYVAASISADAPHVRPGGPIVGDHTFGPGYGYQWWLPEGGLGDYSAIGVYNQYIYVDPTHDTVIVKLSANPAYGTTTKEADNKDLENIAALRAISHNCA